MNISIENKGSQIKVVLLALFIVFGITALIEYNVLANTKGIFSYPLDDAFIHMAIARNIAFFSNWGTNKFQFASASSSILYSLLLAGSFRIFSVHTIIPFVINVLAATLLILAISRWLKKEKVGATAQLIIIGCVIVFTPLPIIIMTGMEHTLQCLFSFLFIFTFSDWVGKMIHEKSHQWKLPLHVTLYGILATSIRFEGMFLIAIAGLILFYHKKFAMAVQLGLITMLPVIVFGIYSMAKGGFFFPNSLLVKTESIELSITGIRQYISKIVIDRLTLTAGIEGIATRQLLFILPLTYLVFSSVFRLKTSHRYILIMLTTCTLFQLSFAAVGWVYRYEAYLILCSTIILSVIFYDNRRAILARKRELNLFLLLLMFLLFSPFAIRTVYAFTKITRACINIYEQQYQMGKFMNKYYKTKNVAANDIGAISYFTLGNNVDLWGLGDNEVAKSRVKKYWTPDFLYNLSKRRNVRVVVVYDRWFDPLLLKRWNKVASWQIPDNVICADDIVTFYSPDENNSEELKRNLHDYQKSLPPAVRVTYY
jgi:hypothetical protein